jgi:hypothetical protein
VLPHSKIKADARRRGQCAKVNSGRGLSRRSGAETEVPEAAGANLVLFLLQPLAFSLQPLKYGAVVDGLADA